MALQHRFHPELIRLFVALRARRPYAGPLIAVEHAILDPGRIGVQAHDTTESIDLPNHMSLGQPADGRVARHLADRIKVLRQHQRPTAKPGRGHRRLDTCVAAAHNKDLILSRVDKHDRIVPQVFGKSTAGPAFNGSTAVSP